MNAACFSRIAYNEVLVDGHTERRSRAIAFHASDHHGDVGVSDIRVCLDTMLHDLGPESFDRTEKNIVARGYDAAAATALFTSRCLLWHVVGGDSSGQPALLILPFNAAAAEKCWECARRRATSGRPPAAAADAFPPFLEELQDGQ